MTQDMTDAALSETTYTATFRPHAKGFGFATVVNGDTVEPEQIFIPPQLTRGVLADDQISVTAVNDTKGLRATQVAVTGRSRRMASGVVAQRAGRDVLLADPTLTTSWVALDGPLAERLRVSDGRLVVVLLTDSRDELRAQALVAGPFVDGSPAAVRARLVVSTFGRITPADFAGSQAGTTGASSAATTHVKTIGLLAGGKRGAADGLERTGPVPGDVTGFRERRDEPCVTIDDATSRDLDDAVWGAWDGEAATDVTVAVHIVDAARAIGIDSPADQYARTVAATTYFTVGDNAPMLDATLSEDALSLLPDVDRFVLSVRFRITPDGQIVDPTLEQAAIRSHAKLTYSTLDAFMNGDVSGMQSHDTDAAGTLYPVLDALVEAARRLGTTRDAAGSVATLFADITEEPTVVDGRLTARPATSFTNANRVVERLMVAANETVAAWLTTRGVAALYRNHTGVDAEKVKRVFAACEQLGVAIERPPDSTTDGPELIAAVIRAAEDATTDVTTRDLVLQVLAGATARASYSAAPKAHAGLNAAVYTHFTSPLRRYADLVVHRQLRAALAGEPPPYDADTLETLGVWLDARMGVTAQLASAERAALWDLLLSRGAVDPDTTATVTAVTKPGLRLRFTHRGTTGFLPAATLPSNEPISQLDVDPFELSSTDQAWQVGQVLNVTFDGTDALGRANWRLTDAT